MFKAKIIRKSVKWNDANLRVYRIKEKAYQTLKGAKKYYWKVSIKSIILLKLQ